jgi:acyl-CoA dehydrogenase
VSDDPVDRAQSLGKRVAGFMDEYVYAAERQYEEQVDAAASRWETVPPVILELRAKAKAAGLWNLFLPKREFPDALTNLQYAPLAETMGRSPIGAQVFNCSAPDSGNMETLALYGTADQKSRWLTPLLEGAIRSCFAMTEPEVASSDATNIRSEIRRDGDHYVINGRKWWTSGALDPRCKIIIFMGKTSDTAPAYRRQSMILVPMDTPGIRSVRALKVLGFDDAPHGHAEMIFENVRVPASNMLLGEGRGFEIAQGRLGPGRIHHAARLIGVAERALQTMIARGLSRTAFGELLIDHGVNRHWIAQSRIEIEQARLLVHKAALLMDTVGNKEAKVEIAMIKVVAPNVASAVVDRAIQMCGGAGVSQEFHLARAFAYARALRLADGPDEVHRASIAKLEIAKYRQAAAARAGQKSSDA